MSRIDWGKLSVGGGETSAEAGRPLNSFALFHLLSLERAGSVSGYGGEMESLVLDMFV